MTANLTLITGGAASGKSAFAENLVRALGGRRHYLATAQAFDAEMRAKIQNHQVMRGVDWITHEEPIDPASVLATLQSGDILLLDCATLWLTNLMLADHDIAAETAKLMTAIDATPAKIVVVSNEVGSGIVPQDALSRRFRQCQGELNQLLAAKAALAVAVLSGLPLVLKGRLPAALPRFTS